ncbi:unnamed protein product [Lota lota]
MLSAGRGVCLGRPHHGGTHTVPWTGTRGCRSRGLPSFVAIFTFVLLLTLPLQGSAWPHDYRYGYYDHCPGPEWSVMCRNCCEYDIIRCKCPLQGTRVGYAVPCCRNAINECDPCIIHPGCSIFENCKRCNNGTWGPRDDFFIRGKFCAECRPGWSGGDCLQCGGVVRKRQGHLVLESYPNNARCEWTLQVDRAFTIDFRFMMLSLEFDHSCRYDYIELRDGNSINSQVIGRFCGNSRPGPIQSSGNTLHVLFVSDGYKNFDGFFATFQESSACSSSPCLHDGTCVLDTSYSFHCACLSGYTGRRCENVVGCRRPPIPPHGSTQGVFYHSGARVTFHCDPGFQLSGARSSICLLDGTWSTSDPQCVPVERTCSLPPKPAHGDHFLVYGPNDPVPGLAPETVEYFCNHSYALSGDARRVCQPNGTWSGTQPVCVRACREPKVSELVRQKVLPLQIPSRKTPIHKLYSMGLGHLLQADEPREASQALPPGFHHLYAQIEYQCASPYYHHAGSARRTCLKTGKWSGRHVSCSPVCGKHSAFDPQRPAEAHWPWLAAIYRRSTKSANASKDAASDWQLVCSGALVNQRSVVVAAHCVTELGKVYPLGTAKMKVVVGKHYRHDLRASKGLQHLRVASVAVHPNYDPLILDSDLAVVRLLDKARVGEQTLPLCLPDGRVGPEAGVSREGLVTGWSPLPDPALGDEERARVGVVRLADVVPCEQQYARNGAPVSVSDNMLCASHKPDYGASNICPSDTGGILVLPGSLAGSPGAGAGGRDSTSGGPAGGPAQWRLMGLVSFGYEQGECDPALYTVYTRVANFKDWIESHMR